MIRYASLKVWLTQELEVESWQESSAVSFGVGMHNNNSYTDEQPLEMSRQAAYATEFLQFISRALLVVDVALGVTGVGHIVGLPVQAAIV